MPTSRSGGSRPPPDFAMICSSMAGDSLQPHPPPWDRLVSRTPCTPYTPCTYRTYLPGSRVILGRPGQNGLLNVLDCFEAARWRAAPLETGRVRRPAKQHDVPGGGDASALVVDEAMKITRAPGRDQPANRKLRNDEDVGLLKGGSGFSDVECRAAEDRLHLLADTERQATDGRHDRELLVLKVSP